MGIRDHFQKLLMLRFLGRKRAANVLREIFSKMIWILKKRLVHLKNNRMNVVCRVRMLEVAIVATIKNMKAVLILIQKTDSILI